MNRDFWDSSYAKLLWNLMERSPETHIYVITKSALWTIWKPISAQGSKMR